MPLINSSLLFGATPSDDETFSTAVALWPLKGFETDDFFAFTSISSPRIRVMDETIRMLPSSKVEEVHYASGLVEVNNQLGIIPDLKAVLRDIF